MTWIKEKLKRWWKWFLGGTGIISVAFAAPLFFGAAQCTETFIENIDNDPTSQNINYRSSYRESFLNIEHMNTVVSANPQSYPHCMILPEEPGYESPKVLILIWDEFQATSVEDAISKIKLSNREIASLDIKNSNGKWFKKYDKGKIPK